MCAPARLHNHDERAHLEQRAERRDKRGREREQPSGGARQQGCKIRVGHVRQTRSGQREIDQRKAQRYKDEREEHADRDLYQKDGPRVHHEQVPGIA